MASEGKIPSASALFKVTKQAAKGTPATTGFVCGLMQQSGLNLSFDTIDKGVEHGCVGSGASRPTARKSSQPRTSYLATGPFRAALYPAMIGYWLLGAGFKVSTVDNTTHRTHTFTLANRDELHWLTILSQIGSVLRRASDARVNNLVISASNTGITYNGTYNALIQDEGTGAETDTDETNVDLLPTKGALTINADPDGSPVTIISEAENISMTVANPQDTETQKMFTFGRSDLPPNGVDITGQVGGVSIDYDVYDRVYNGGVGNPSPAEQTLIASLAYDYRSAANIPGAAVPYSFAVSIPHVEIGMQDFEANGNAAIDWSFTYTMIDDVATPITVTLINELAAY